MDAWREEMNLEALERMSAFLRNHPRMIAPEDVREIVEACGVTQEEAVLALLCAACGLDRERGGRDRELMDRYFRPSLRRLDARTFEQNAYYRGILLPNARQGRWTLEHMAYEPYEIFVRDDLILLPDGREIPQLGYFDRQFVYPAVLEGGREWMTVTPNEIATMEKAVEEAGGHVVAMGLGLGYFAFMASRKQAVRQVTVVERDADVIALFERHILPQFAHREKVCIVRADAFDFARDMLPGLHADFAFVDLWHDVGDGAELYLRMKSLEGRAEETRFCYWIERSLRSFIAGVARKT